mgnify:CR=1 FL=1
MKKINFIRANKTKFGGAEVYLTRLCEALTKQNIEFEVINSKIPKFLPSWVRVLLFNRQVSQHKNSQFYFSLERISCPDIYRAGDGVHKVFLSIENKSKTNLLHKVYLSLEKKCFNNAKKIIANSNMIKTEIINTFNIKPEKIEVIYNGVNLEKPDFKTSYKNVGKEFKLYKSKGQKVFVYVGSGFKRKGVEEFLEILSKLEYKNFKAFIIGKEKRMQSYKEKSKELGIENKVVFTGPRTDVKDFYTVADIFLFPTRYEPFSNVVLEAMNYSNVVITTKQNGAHEILPEEFIMENSKDFSIVKTIDTLLEDDKKLNKIKYNNMQTVKKFSIEKNLEKTLKVINEVID